MKKVLLGLGLMLLTFLISGCEYFEQGDKTYISFDTYGAGQLERIELKDFTELPSLEREGYDFEGWYYDRGFSVEVTIENIMLIEESVSIYAKWVPTVNKYTVRFLDYDGRIIDEKIVSPNDSVIAPLPPTRNGYTFTGWDKELSEVKENMDVKALYNINIYTVKFIDYDGTELKSEPVEYLASATAPNDPSRANYDFLGWDKAFDEITESIIVTAMYENKTLTITYNTMGGNAIIPQKISIGGDIPLPIPTKAGYVFNGWTYEGSPLSITRAYNDMTLVATWGTIGTYTITFNTKGGNNIAALNATDNQLITSLPVATKAGNTFLHWICEGFIVGTPMMFTYQKSVTFEAVYTTTYYSSGSTVSYRNKSTLVTIPDTYAQKKEEFRGVWVSFIVNDLKSYQNETQMKNQLTTILNNLVAWNMNAIVFHIRTHNNAYYNTTRDPKASYVAAANFNEWDYLTWLIDECHKRNIEFHAWLNPYRLSSSSVATTVANYANYPLNPASKAENILVGTSGAILNPGEPAVREYVVDTCMEIIEKYNVDAIHFDDYFYITMDASADSATYNKYKASSQTTNISDWRREQVDIFIRDLSISIRAYNDISGRSVELGISPSGIWRNGTGSSALVYQNGQAVTNGSNTAGMEHYGNYLYSDTKKWIDNEWIDYIIPQTYWSFTQTVAQYAELADWWSMVVRYKNVKLYMGMGIYMTSYGWGSNPYEASDQVLYNTKNPEIDGVCLFRYGTILQRISDNNPGTLRLINDYWKTPVSVPKK